MANVFGVGSTMDIVGVSGTPGMTGVNVEQVFEHAIVIYKAAIGTLFLPLSSIVYAAVSSNGTAPSNSVSVDVTSLPDRLTTDA